MYWKQDEEYKKKTWEYKIQAEEVANRWNFDECVTHLWMTDVDDEDCKVFVKEFEGNHCELLGSPRNIRDRLMYWADTPKDGTEGKTNRRLIIVENVGPRTAELLGVKLDIPPEFFLAHCDEYVNLSVVDALGLKQNNSTYWRVPVSQTRGLPQGCKELGECYIENGHFCRHGEATLNSDNDTHNFDSFMSYWGRRYGRESWTGKEASYLPIDREGLTCFLRSCLAG